MIDRDRLTCIAIVAQPHGLKGALKLTPLTGTPRYYGAAKKVILQLPAGLKAFPVKELDLAARGWIMVLEGVADRSSAEALRGAQVLLEETELRPLERGEYFQHDLVGCEVETGEGQRLGRVEEVIETGANDVLAVGGKGGTVMIPLVAAVVKEVDLEGRRIRIDPLPGLLEPEGDDEAH